MRKEVNREYKYIANGIRERQRKLMEASESHTHKATTQSREGITRRNQLQHARSCVSQQKLQNELFLAGPTLSPRTTDKFGYHSFPFGKADEKSPKTGSPISTWQARMFSPVLDEMKGSDTSRDRQRSTDISVQKRHKQLSSKAINEDAAAPDPPNLEHQHLLGTGIFRGRTSLPEDAASGTNQCWCCMLY